MRVLVAEAEPITRTLLTTSLARWGHQVEVASDITSTWAALSHPSPPSLAIVASTLSDGGSAELLQRLDALPRTRMTWVLLRLAAGNERPDNHADDVLPVPFSLATLRTRVRVGLRSQALAAELTQTRSQLTALTRIDPLTGIASRSAVMEALHRAVARGARETESVAVIIADLDGFRRVNQAFGAAAGDGALRETAARWASAVRSYDVIGRSGGQEFLIVLPGCSAPGAQRLAERLRAAIRDRALVTHEGPVALTSSFGVASVDLSDADRAGLRRVDSSEDAPAVHRADAEALLRRATSALAEAKSSGGDCVRQG